MASDDKNIAANSPNGTPHLRRVLTLRDLFIYGIVAVTPSAPVTVFGQASVMSHGLALDTILIGMGAMVLTAISYGRMSALYPSAGSAYTYVGRGINPFLGFLAGWAMLLDYLIIPLFCVIYGSLAGRRLIPEIPYAVWAAFFAGVMTFLNLIGIRSTARANMTLLSVMGGVLIAFIILAIRFVISHHGWTGLFSLKPFYDPSNFHWRSFADWQSLATATSFSALTYLGFDSVTTLAEDAKNPRRDVLLATVLVCLFTGVFGSILVYLAQLAWPDFHTYKDVATAFMDVTRLVGGNWLFDSMAILLILANVGAGLTSQVGAARLLFGMGRDGVLPRRVFAYLHPKRNSPTINIWIIGIIAYVGSLLMNFELTGEILNFGAFLGFMGVNIAAFWQFYIIGQPQHKRHFFTDVLLPGLGFLFCLAIWLGLAMPAKIAGGIWFAGGLLYLGITTRGFRVFPQMTRFE
jgi:putrescine importer